MPVEGIVNKARTNQRVSSVCMHTSSVKLNGVLKFLTFPDEIKKSSIFLLLFERNTEIWYRRVK